MAVFHRVTTYVLASLLLIGGGALVAFVGALPGPYSVTAFDGQQFSFAPLSAFDKLATGVIGLLILLAGVFLLAFELLGPPTRQHVPLHTSENRRAVIARQSVEQRLAAVLEGISGVLQATPHVHVGRAGVAVDAYLLTDPIAPAPALCEQANALLVSTLEHDFGLRAGLLRVYIRHPQRESHTGSAPAAA